jgi:hypothetical protein
MEVEDKDFWYENCWKGVGNRLENVRRTNTERSLLERLKGSGRGGLRRLDLVENEEGATTRAADAIRRVFR